MAKNWYPVIDYEKCSGCLTCFNFCPHDVYEVRGDGEPLVANPSNCVELCRGCQKICPNEAISYRGDLATE
ncbi:ferredoxin family protein [Thermosphaera chiliense]|uniref:Ferredoxin family protein n=1 Tax=Thermosphaera chiliense TaxID=3402707 RepID=A0A7M1URF4_9CREN|nr:ferredoxin family protein [Thermosphaera aggregans]QOR94771.1 ferredoxin family protein [Thermosphaera aggregans]